MSKGLFWGWGGVRRIILFKLGLDKNQSVLLLKWEKFQNKFGNLKIKIFTLARR